MTASIVSGRLLAGGALVAAALLFAGCLAAPGPSEPGASDEIGDDETPSIDEAELEVKGAPSCSPACNLKQTCTSGNCCVAKETPFTECALQDDADDTIVIDDADYAYQYSSSEYGDAECNKFIVDMVPGAHNWERIEAQTNYSGFTECECRAHDMYLNVRGMYEQYTCMFGGCYPLVDPDHEEVVTAKGVWIASSQRCQMHAVIPRLGNPDAPGPTPHWLGPVQVQAQARHRGVAGDLGFYVYAVVEP